MKIQGIISAVALTLGVAFSAPTLACSPGEDVSGIPGVLLSEPGHNQNLGCGTYEFAGTNSQPGAWLTDFWQFSLAQDSTVSISVFDIELDAESPNESQTFSSNTVGNVDTTKIFDTKDLFFMLYDNAADQFLAWAPENGTLSGLTLKAGQLYTIKVFGDVAGTFGSAYQGTLETCVTEVPIGGTAPLLGSALGLFALRLRNRAARANG